MSDPKVTTMVITVDLQCEKCYKKIKKVLCKFPQIQDQEYDEKNNAVIIKVVCCSPEKIKQKICCKGGDSVKGIEIKLPEKRKEQEKKITVPSKEDAKTQTQPDPLVPAPPPSKLLDLVPVSTLVLRFPPPSAGYHPPIGVCCSSCYEGQPGGPCYHGYRGPQMVPCYGRPVYDSWGCGGGGYRSYYGSRCDYYVSIEENQPACSIM